MLKTLSIKLVEPKKCGSGITGDSGAGQNGSEIDGVKIENNEVGKKVQKPSKSKNLSKSKKTVAFLDFFTLKAKLAFTELR